MLSLLLQLQTLKTDSHCIVDDRQLKTVTKKWLAIVVGFFTGNGTANHASLRRNSSGTSSECDHTL